MSDTNDLDASYSGITQMIDEEGYEDTFKYLMTNHALQLNRVEIASEQLKSAENNLRTSSLAMSHYALRASRSDVAESSGKTVFINYVTPAAVLLFEIDTESHIVTITQHKITDLTKPIS